MIDHAMDVRALLFDFDGVLVNSAAVVERAWARWAAAQGLDAERVVATIHGVRAVENVRMLAPHLDAAAEAARIEAYEVDHAGQVAVFPGAAALLSGLPDGSWAIVTSGTRRLATARLEAIGLPVPDVFVTADDVDRGKPAPDPYLRAAARLGVAPGECVVVEDSPAGVTAGRSAGMRVIAVTSTHARGQFDDPTVVIDSITALRVSGESDGCLRVHARASG